MFLFIDIILYKISRAFGLEVDSMQKGGNQSPAMLGIKMCVPHLKAELFTCSCRVFWDHSVWNLRLGDILRHFYYLVHAYF